MSEAHARARQISCDDAKAIIARDDTLILDVREEVVFTKSHIEGAVNLRLKNLCGVVEETRKSRPLLVYCQHGNVSMEYSSFLAHCGFSEVYSLEGGYEAWSRRRLVVSASQAGATGVQSPRNRAIGKREAPGSGGPAVLLKASHEGISRSLKN